MKEPYKPAPKKSADPRTPYHTDGLPGLKKIGKDSKRTNK